MTSCEKEWRDQAILSAIAAEPAWEIGSYLFRRTLVDGNRSAGVLARRKVNGAYQYRRATREEEHDHLAAVWP